MRDAMVVGDVLAVVLGGLFTLWLMPRVFGASLITLAREPVSREYVRELYRFSKPLWVGGQNSTGVIRFTLAVSACNCHEDPLGCPRPFHTMRVKKCCQPWARVG